MTYRKQRDINKHHHSMQRQRTKQKVDTAAQGNGFSSKALHEFEWIFTILCCHTSNCTRYPLYQYPKTISQTLAYPQHHWISAKKTNITGRMEYNQRRDKNWGPNPIMILCCLKSSLLSAVYTNLSLTTNYWFFFYLCFVYYPCVMMCVCCILIKITYLLTYLKSPISKVR